MRTLDRTFQGLQFLVLSHTIVGMSLVFCLLSGLLSLSSPNSPLISKVHTLMQMTLVIGLAMSSLGKMACLGNPESEARLRHLQTLPLEALLWIIVPVALNHSWTFLIVFSAALSQLAFLRFLCHFNATAGGVYQEGRVVALLGTLGIGSLSYLFASPSFGLGTCLMIISLTAALFFSARIVWSALRVLPLYLEEVRLGLTDASLSAEERNRLARVERLNAARSGLVDPEQKVGSEQPQAEPPEGALLYRIPRALSALHLAVKDGDSDKVAHLIINGADVSATVAHDLSPLHIACSTGVLETADRLIRGGAKVDQIAECGLTPLFMAVQNGNRNLVGYLKAKGANLKHRNNQGLTPLHWACSVIHPRLTTSSRLAMINYLLDLGASHRMKTLAGETPAELAERNDLQYVVELFEKRFPVLSKRRASFSEVVDEVKVPEHPLNTPFRALHLSQVPEELSPFHEAVKQGELEKLDAAFQDSVSLKEELSHGRTAIHLAALSGVMSTAHRLIEKGADVKERASFGVTPLMLAVHRGNLAVVGYLLAQGADPNAADDMGRTALHWAAAAESSWLDGNNRVVMVKFLLERGARPDVVDASGDRPLDLAREAYEESVVDLLDDTDSSSMEEISEEDLYYV